MKLEIPAIVIDGINQFNALASSYEAEARSAHLIGDTDSAVGGYRAAYGVRLTTARHATALLEFYTGEQVQFRRALARLWCSCAQHAMRLGRYDAATEHARAGLRMRPDPQTAQALRATLVGADLAKEPVEAW